MTNGIKSGWGNRLPVMLQSEASECGTAALAMISSYYGYGVGVSELRSRFPTSLKGITLTNLLRIAGEIGLASRALRLEADDLSQLRLPCILHWNFNHFVVLKRVSANGRLHIHDPATGARQISRDEASRTFTGVAVELWPKPDFTFREKEPPVKMKSLIGRLVGLKSTLAWILVLAMSLEVLLLVSPFYMQWVIDNVIVSADFNLLTMLTLAFGLLLIVQQFVQLSRSWAIIHFNAVVSSQWQSNVFGHLLSLPTQYFEKRHLGDVVSRFGSTDTIQKTLTASFIESALDGVMGLLVVIMMYIYSPLLASIAIASAGIYGIIRWAWFNPMRHAMEEQIIYAAKQQSHFLETVRGMRTLKLFSRQEERRGSWMAMLTDQINAGLKAQRLSLFYRLTNGIVFGLENLVIVWIGARMVISGQFTLGALTAFLAFRGQFGTRASNLIDKYVDVRMLRVQADRLSDIVLSEPEDSKMYIGSDDDAFTGRLEVKNVSFRYSEFDPYVLKNVSLTVDDGEAVAIIGPSGCGKSTLVSIILGMLSPQKGEVLISGNSVSKSGLEFLRSKVGAVLQDDALFAGTIAENISFFDTSTDLAWVEQCAKMACIHDEVQAMPMGYNSLIGDMGTVLSGGQKQRVLLARALYKKPRILVLDEATSHLDTSKEQEVNRTIGALRMTRIIIAHRPETIASADRAIDLTRTVESEPGL